MVCLIEYAIWHLGLKKLFEGLVQPIHKEDVEIESIIFPQIFLSSRPLKCLEPTSAVDELSPSVG